MRAERESEGAGALMLKPLKSSLVTQHLFTLVTLTLLYSKHFCLDLFLDMSIHWIDSRSMI